MREIQRKGSQILMIIRITKLLHGKDFPLFFLYELLRNLRNIYEEMSIFLVLTSWMVFLGADFKNARCQDIACRQGGRSR